MCKAAIMFFSQVRDQRCKKLQFTVIYSENISVCQWDDQTTSGTRKATERREDTRAKVLCSSCSCLGQTPLRLHPAPLPPPPPPPQLAPSKREITVSEKSALFKDELQLLLLLLFVSAALSVFLHPPPPSPVLFDFLRGFFVGVTPLNGTMQPSVKLKLLVSLELLKRGFYTCMHSYTLPYYRYS